MFIFPYSPQYILFLISFSNTLHGHARLHVTEFFFQSSVIWSSLNVVAPFHAHHHACHHASAITPPAWHTLFHCTAYPPYPLSTVSLAFTGLYVHKLKDLAIWWLVFKRLCIWIGVYSDLGITWYLILGLMGKTSLPPGFRFYQMDRQIWYISLSSVHLRNCVLERRWKGCFCIQGLFARGVTMTTWRFYGSDG